MMMTNLDDKKYESSDFEKEQCEIVVNMMKNLGDLDEKSSSELEEKKKEECKMVVIIISTFVVIIPTHPTRPISMVDLGCRDHPVIEYEHFLQSMQSFCATTSGGPRIYLFGGHIWEPSLNNMYSYDLLDLNKHQFNRCNPTPFKPAKPLIVPVGESVYFFEVCSDDGSLIFSKYQPEDDLWDILPSRFITEEVTLKAQYMHFASHVVIGHKIHISLFNDTGGVSSFAFDTKNQAWEFSYLFDTYWSKVTNTKLSPSNFYGGRVWNVYYHRRFFGGEEIRTTSNSQPFGFFGKGIMWGKENVLLGLHCFSNECQLVAFQLDGMGRVVDSQPFALSDLVHLLIRQSHLVDIDLDGDGVFGLLQFVYHRVTEQDQLELLTCKIQRVSEAEVDNGRTFSIQVLKKEAVENVIKYKCNVFSL